MVDDSSFEYLLDGFVREAKCRAELCWLGSQSFFGLRVECRVLDEGVHEDP